MNDEEKWEREAFLEKQRYIAGLEKEIAELKAENAEMHESLDLSNKVIKRQLEEKNELYAQVGQLQKLLGQSVQDEHAALVKEYVTGIKDARKALEGK
jgi:hypothetical protein